MPASRNPCSAPIIGSYQVTVLVRGSPQLVGVLGQLGEGHRVFASLSLWVG